MREPKYNIGDTVYHATPNSEAGVIVDIFFSYRKKEHSYVISLGWGEECVCLEPSIVEDKIF